MIHLQQYLEIHDIFLGEILHESIRDLNTIVLVNVGVSDLGVWEEQVLNRLIDFSNQRCELETGQ
jgi:hypothetical protein